MPPCYKTETTSTEQRTTELFSSTEPPDCMRGEGNTVRALQVVIFSGKNKRRSFWSRCCRKSAFLKLDFLWQKLPVEAFSGLCTCRIHFVLHYRLPPCVTILHTLCTYPVCNMWILTAWSTLNHCSLEYSEVLLKRRRSFHARLYHLVKAAMRVLMFKKQTKKKTFFFFNFERSIFHSSFSQCSKENGGFKFKKKEQTCGKRLGLESCFLKFEVKGSDGQVKYVLWDYIAVTAICNEKLIFCRSFLKYITNSESVRKIHGFCFFYSLFKSTELI